MDHRIIFSVIITLAVFAPLVSAAPVPGVTKVTKTLSCCGKVYIPLTQGCLNTFEIGNEPYAVLENDVKEPFQLQMEVPECKDFTHTSSCDVGVNYTRQVIIEYKVTPCSKDNAPGAAAVPQGSLFSFLLAIALMMMFF